MKVQAMKWLGVFGLLFGTLGIAAEIPMYFQTATPPVVVFNPPAKSPLALANEAFLVKYGAEYGVLGTTAGIQGQLVVLVNDMQIASNLWAKMVGAGDAYNGLNGGMFRYADYSTPVYSDWRFVGRIQIPENNIGRLVLLNGTPAVRGFLVVMDNQCVFSKAAVETINNVPVQATQLISSQKVGYTGIGYEHLVNGGAGALLSSILVTMGVHHPSGPWNQICPVDIYIRH
ncbi:hypothetical protein EBQ74_10370 [bacterium]|nr:hypothetical protein [bacterium]